MRVPPRFKDATLASFQTPHPSQRAALLKVREWLEAATSAEVGPMLALVGKKGRGKSHLLWAAARALTEALEVLEAENGGRPLWRPAARSWYELAATLERRAENRAENWSRINDAKVLMLDEVRPIQVGAKEAPDRDLTRLVMRAYDNVVPMLVTTNRKLEECMGEAAASRFLTVVVDGPNWRER